MRKRITRWFAVGVWDIRNVAIVSVAKLISWLPKIGNTLIDLALIGIAGIVGIASWIVRASTSRF